MTASVKPLRFILYATCTDMQGDLFCVAVHDWRPMFPINMLSELQQRQQHLQHRKQREQQQMLTRTLQHIRVYARRGNFSFSPV